MGYLSEANELQPGLVPSHCYLPATQKVTVSRNMSILNPDRDGLRLLDAYCCNFVTLLVIIQLQGY